MLTQLVKLSALVLLLVEVHLLVLHCVYVRHRGLLVDLLQALLVKLEIPARHRSRHLALTSAASSAARGPSRCTWVLSYLFLV